MLPKGDTIVLLHRVRIHAVDSDQFKEFYDELSGLTADNKPAVQAKLAQLGPNLAPMNN